MTDQRNEDLQRARREAAELLGVKDLEHATQAECLRIDLVVGLRACVDSGAAEALEGGRTDIGRLVAAVEQLTKLLPAVRAPVANEYGEDPRRALLAEYLAARQAAEDTASREASALEVVALELEQAAERAREPPEVVPADNVVPLQKPEPPPL